MIISQPAASSKAPPKKHLQRSNVPAFLAAVLGAALVAAALLGCSAAVKEPTAVPPKTDTPDDEAGKVWEQVRTGGGFPDHNGNTGQDLRDVVFGDGRFVVVGEVGTISSATNIDGISVILGRAD